MALNSITTSTKILADLLVASPGFNTIKNELFSLMVTGYGSSMSAPSVSSGNLIGSEEWISLANDFQRVKVHQSGTTQTFTIGYPIDGSIARQSFANELVNAINNAYANSSTIHISQIDASEGLMLSSRLLGWTSAISHKIKYSWSALVQLKNYYNLGSHTTFEITAEMPSGVSPNAGDILWQNLIGISNLRMSNFKYGYFDYIRSDTILYASWNGTNLIWSTSSSSTIASDSGNTIKLKAERSGTDIFFELILTPSVVTAVNLRPTSRMTNNRSRGDVVVSGYYGIAAPKPTVSQQQGLNEEGIEPPPPTPTRILRVFPSSFNYSFEVNTTSPTQTVTLANEGNTDLIISNITNFTTVGSVNPIVVFSWSGGGFPLTIGPASNATFTLAYSGSTVGTFNNSFTIISNNDLGIVSVSTQQTISTPAFNFTLNPSSWSPTLTSITPVEQKFTITTNNGTTPGTAYTYNFSGGSTTGFSVIQTFNGPTVTFNPTGFSVGTYSITLNVTHNTVTRSALITINIASLLVTQNLGSWISPVQKNNAVAAISYDIINSVRYVTLAFSLGADGSKRLFSESGYSSYISSTVLNHTADPKFLQGPVVYPIDQTNPSIPTFLKNYGVWIRDPAYGTDKQDPVGSSLIISRSFRFTVPSSGTYNWTMSARDTGYFAIDGVTVGDYRGSAASEINGVVTLTAGERALTWYCYSQNATSSKGIAIRITSSSGQEIWSTRTPVRSSPTYRYWQEVYRVPLPATNGSIVSSNNVSYLVKDYNAAGTTNYGYFFNNGYMWRLNHEADGGVNIDFSLTNNGQASANYRSDVSDFGYLPYYYSLRVSRVSNLETPSGGQTRFFRGFNANGTVRTTLVNIPVGQINVGAINSPAIVGLQIRDPNTQFVPVFFIENRSSTRNLTITGFSYSFDDGEIIVNNEFGNDPQNLTRVIATSYPTPYSANYINGSPGDGRAPSPRTIPPNTKVEFWLAVFLYNSFSFSKPTGTLRHYITTDDPDNPQVSVAVTISMSTYDIPSPG